MTTAHPTQPTVPATQSAVLGKLNKFLRELERNGVTPEHQQRFCDDETFRTQVLAGFGITVEVFELPAFFDAQAAKSFFDTLLTVGPLWDHRTEQFMIDMRTPEMARVLLHGTRNTKNQQLILLAFGLETGERMTRAEVCAELGMSPKTFDRRRKQALDAMANSLYRTWIIHEREAEFARVKGTIDEIYNEIGMSAHAHLAAAGIRTLAELETHSVATLMSLDGMSIGYVKLIESALGRRGLALEIDLE